MQHQLGQSLGATLGQFAFGGDTRKSDLKGMLDGARAGAYDANRQMSLARTLESEAKAEQTRMENRSREPGAVLRNAMTNFGIPQNEAQAVEQFMQTGRLGGGYDVAADGMGPVMPPPSWAGKLPDVGRTVSGINNALTVGDKSSKSIAEADAVYNNTGMVKRVASGGDQSAVIRALLAEKGKGEFENLGGNGVFSGISGKQDLNAVGTTAAQQNRAQANNANASAGQHSAQTAKIKQETEQGGRSGQTQIVTDANGNVTLVNKVTGQARPATYADGSTVGAKVGAKGGGNATEGERNAAGYADRMIAAENILTRTAAQDPGAMKAGLAEQALGGRSMIANGMRSETRQQYRQAQEDWVRAKLRKESGAVIGEEEMDREISVYFPQINDKPAVIKQKGDARKVAESAMKKAAGRATVDDAPGGMIAVTTAEDYAKVPSGATYTTPDGATRKKP